MNERDQAVIEEGRLVHACPVNGSGVTGCCGKTLYEIPVTDRVTQNRHQVTCTDRENGSAER
ncbi:hypothetical protein [Microbacterium sp.]|uniref:hypothetical protein n=1 Tax=Microbacterium sp. TaxID=51671 RepID=UPI002811E9D2|nr:hypothetical protein [Microbacterium sp.]